MAKTVIEPSQKVITSALKKRERIQKAIANKQSELNKINEQIAQFGDWMKNLAKPQS